SEEGAAGTGEGFEHLTLLGSERGGIDIDRHGRASQRFGPQLIGRHGANGRVARADHVEDAAGEQRTVVHALDYGELGIRAEGAPVLVRFVKLKLARNAAPDLQRRLVALVQAAREIVIERHDPARTHHGGITDDLRVILGRDYALGWR